MITVTQPMIQTFAALLIAHALADFVFQTNWMVRHKRNLFVLLLHVTIVFAFSTAALGGVWEVALVVALAHFVIDAIKVWVIPAALRDRFTAFTADQIAHILTIILAALWWPSAAGLGTWAAWLEMMTPAAILMSGLILTIRAGGFAVGMLTARYAQILPPQGLPEAGHLIGQLERLLIFFLVMIGQPVGIGFLVAAKSVLRFDTAAQTPKAEYVIIGTLASFAWALVLSYATLGLLEIAATAP